MRTKYSDADHHNLEKAGKHGRSHRWRAGSFMVPHISGYITNTQGKGCPTKGQLDCNTKAICGIWRGKYIMKTEEMFSKMQLRAWCWYKKGNIITVEKDALLSGIDYAKRKEILSK